MIGRARELEVVTDHLRRSRLVTLTGPGGVGKTRLALEVARRRTVRADGGVWLVDLMMVAPGADVASETARILQIGGMTGGAARGALCRSIGDRHAFLVLDNCEHVIDGCAELASALLAACPHVRLLATSREVLGVPGELVVPVDPLAAADAHRLFVERATHRRSDFVPAEVDDDAIAALCRKLDRLPLAIELAAARINAMSPTEIAASLDKRRLELGGLRRTAPTHHRTVRTTVEWSYRLLDGDEQRGFRGLGAFVGSFDAAAADVVAGVGIDVLARLVDKSLVTTVATRAPGTRYRLLETVREFAADLLVQSGRAGDAFARQLRHFSSLSQPTQGWPSPVADWVVASLGEDYGNIRAALEWASTNDACGGLRLLAGTGDLFSMLGHADGWRLAVELLQRCAERDRYRVMVQITAGVIGLQHGPLDVSQAMLTDAAELAGEIAEDGLKGWAATFLGLTAVLSGRLESGRQWLESAQRIHRDRGQPVGEARATSVLGLAYAIDGDYQRARELVDAALTMAAAEGDRWGEGQLHTYLGIISEHLGDPTAATTHNRTAIERFRPFQDSSLLPTALVSQASIIAHRDPARALKVVAAARAIKTRVGSDFPPYFRDRVDRVRALAESTLGAQAAAVWQDGLRLDRDEAIALAFGAAAARPAAVSGLTGREQEVVRLVADGLANKEIAARLHLSARTVESHIRRVLGRLGLHNRTQLATWARDRLS